MTMPLMMFAAGFGTRMKSLTAHQPKPMVQVAGMPLIDHALALTNGQPVGPIVANLHYHGDQIRSHLADCGVVFSDETDALLETGGGLRAAMPLLGGSPVMTLNTDAVWDGPNPIAALLSAWHPRMDALLLTVPPRNAHGHKGSGDFEIQEDGRLIRAAGQVYTGLQIIRTDDLHDIADPAFSLNLVWDKIAARGGLYGLSYGGKWCDVGQPASIQIAQDMIGYHDV